ncbi:protein SHORT HYPOCOTYL IN WHITE LIGHT 1 [Mangifera indica]|uniref:protein SHORT HYPOCOTYL IN WHITE LIGHT 1 n=1 Tax=Mangifera indica TaxID=29780 RepID=UPI001CFA1CFC|nr:protein SHORT HYPOCOTYL IN WHITE LIGHT 1 [Mangifera indica]
MARATILSSPCVIGLPLPLNKLRHSSRLPPPNLPFHNHNKTLRLSLICHGQLDDSAVDDAHDIDRESFLDDLMGDDEDETESSIDLLIRFLQTMFKKLSKRAKKVSCSILPTVISTQLVSFAVDGILLLAALSILKALLEVVCTLGATVFVVILLLRVVWAASSYFQSNGNGFNQGGNSFSTI